MKIFLDVDTMQENLEKLKNLSRDDKTEAAMLRSRIDEQSQLICILKRRADDAVLKATTLEKVNKELEKFRENAQEMLTEEIKRSKMLERRFEELAENHEEMIRFKDDYKRQNEQLRKENEELCKENSTLFSKTLEEKISHIASLEKQVQSLKEQCKEYEQLFSQLKSEIVKSEKAYHTSLSTLQVKLKQSEDKCKEVTTEFTRYKDSTERKEQNSTLQTEKLKKERQEFLDLAMQRGKLLQERQKEIKLMEEKVKEAEKQTEMMEQKFEREAESVSANLRVIRLSGEKEVAEKTLKDLQMEYDAFKKHANSLLAKEKNLNAQLRNLVT